MRAFLSCCVILFFVSVTLPTYDQVSISANTSPTSGNSYSYQQRPIVKATISSNPIFQLPGGCSPGWRIQVTLTESAGVAARLQRMDIISYNDNRVHLRTDTFEGNGLTGFLNACGSDGFNIPANGRLCGDFCVSLGGPRSGVLVIRFVFEFDSDSSICVETEEIVLSPVKSTGGADLSITNVISTYQFTFSLLTKDRFLGLVNPSAVYLHKLTLTNNGPETARNVVLTDRIEAGATFHAIRLEREPKQLSVPPLDGSGTVTCTFESIPPGVSINIWLFVKSTLTVFGSMTTNRAVVTSSTSDPNPDNNLADEKAVLNTSPGVGISRLRMATVLPNGAVDLGRRISYTISVTNNGPSEALVSFAHFAPMGTTFASASIDKGFIFDKPVAGGTGVILARPASGSGFLKVNDSATITVTLNVIGGSVTAGDLSQNILFEGTEVKKFLLSCIGSIPLLSGPEGHVFDGFTGPSAVSYGGGSSIILTWIIGSPSSFDSTPAPRGLSVGGAALIPDEPEEAIASLPAISSGDVAPSAEPCTLIGYKLYLGSNPSLVDPQDSNVWKLLPPNVISTTAPRAPNGSYYRLVAVYRCPDESIVASQPSEEISSGLPPVISTVFREGKNLIVEGNGFANGTRILRNDAPTDKKTIFESANRLRGKKVGKTTRSGDRIKVRNPDGKDSNTVIFP